jgi:hypothetical protein
LTDILGIATEPIGIDQRSEDLVYLDARHWTEEDQARTLELQAATGMLTKPREIAFHDDEYPEQPMVLPTAIPSHETPTDA